VGILPLLISLRFLSTQFLLMPNILTIALREFKAIVLTKSYIASILLVPLVVFFTIAVAFSLQFVNIAAKPILNTVIVDQTGELRRYLTERSSEHKEKLHLLIYSQDQGVADTQTLQNIAVQYRPIAAFDEQNDKEEIRNGKLEGLLIIPSNFFERSQVKYASRNNLMGILPRGMIQMLDAFKLNHLRKEGSLSQEEINKILQPIQAETISVIQGNQRDKGKDSSSIRLLAAAAIYGILSICIAIHGSKLTMSILEEKKSKVMEILLSAVKPIEFIWGKILGSAAAAILQTSIWSALLFFIFIKSGAMVFDITARAIVKSGQMGTSFSPTAGQELVQSTIKENVTIDTLTNPHISVNPETLIYLVSFTILGFLLYATLFAAVGAITNSITEAQYFETPLIFLMMFPTYLFLPLLENPNGPVIVVSSFFPYFTPFVMYSRICVDQVPFWQIMISITLLLIAIVSHGALVAALYRANVLLYGKKLTLTELIKLVKPHK